MNKLDEKGFVFIDENHTPFHVRMWGENAWLFRWHPDGMWVSMRTVTQGEVFSMSPNKLSPEEAQKYHDIANSPVAEVQE